VFWFRPSDPAPYALGAQPVFVWERPRLSPYGFPCLDDDGGVKPGRLTRRGQLVQGVESATESPPCSL